MNYHPHDAGTAGAGELGWLYRHSRARNAHSFAHTHVHDARDVSRSVPRRERAMCVCIVPAGSHCPRAHNVLEPARHHTVLASTSGSVTRTAPPTACGHGER